MEEGVSALDERLAELRKIVGSMRTVRSGDVILPEDHNLFVDFASKAAEVIGLLGVRPPVLYFDQTVLLERLRTALVDRLELEVRPPHRERDALLADARTVDVAYNVYIQKSNIDVMDYTVLVARSVVEGLVPGRW